jgi:hypothetical protein
VPREVEKALRWDGVTCQCAGKEPEILHEYLRTSSTHGDIRQPSNP